MAIKPFKFKLKKVSAKQQLLLDALYEYLPATGIREGFVERAIKDVVDRLVNEKISLRLEAMHREPFAAYVAKMPDPTITAVFGMSPLNIKAFCEIDPILAIKFVEKLLGGKSKTMPQTRELSETEQGVLQYLILQVLANIYRVCKKNPRVHFRFDKFVSGPHVLRDIADRDDGVVIFVYRLKVGAHAGFVRLAFPDPFIQEAFLNVEGAGEERLTERIHTLKRAARFGYVRVPLWAEVGRTTLRSAELSQLEEGDIVLLDDSDIALYDGKPSGNVVVRVGDGEHSGFDAELELEKKRTRCKIIGFRGV